MKWYNKSLSSDIDGIDLELCGFYNSPEDILEDPNKSTIYILLMVHTSSGTHEVSLYRHDPQSLAYEEPTEEQIRTKYISKISKCAKMVSGWSQDQLMAKIDS
jgi:hypothetical protein